MRQSHWTVVWGIIWAVSYFGARALLETLEGTQEWLRLTIAAAPFVPFLAFMLAFIANLRAADELHRKVQLEALAIAFPLAVAFFMALGLVDLVVALPEEDFSYRHVWYALPFFYFVGLAFAWRRYK